MTLHAVLSSLYMNNTSFYFQIIMFCNLNFHLTDCKLSIVCCPLSLKLYFFIFNENKSKNFFYFCFCLILSACYPVPNNWFVVHVLSSYLSSSLLGPWEASQHAMGKKIQWISVCQATDTWYWCYFILYYVFFKGLSKSIL